MILIGCSPQPAENIPVTIPAPVATPTEQEWNFDTDIRASGEVILTEEINLSFSIAGLLNELLVEEGDFIHAGDVIARLDTTTLDNDVSRAEAALIVAQANLEQVKAGPNEAQITEAENDVAAISAQRPIGIAQREIQVANLAAAQARLDFLLAQPLPEVVAVSEANVSQTSTNLEIAKSRLALAELVAPMDGTVTNVFVEAHEYTGIGQPIVQLSDLTQLSIETEIDDIELVGIALGDQVAISFQSLPGIEASGVVTYIEPNDVENRSGIFTILVEFSEIPNGVRWGITAEVFFQSE
jgi:multidrug efflux pump subunit AcrA (membrane-fusion protein)